MESTKKVKPNRMILIANQLEEHPEKERQEFLSLDALMKHARRQDESKLQREDIFIGESCKWENVKERIEEYKDLSFLREVHLEVFYYCPFSFINEKFVGEAAGYLHFFDRCVKAEKLDNLFGHLVSNFECHWHHLESIFEYFQSRSSEVKQSKLGQCEIKGILSNSLLIGDISENLEQITSPRPIFA